MNAASFRFRRLLPVALAGGLLILGSAPQAHAEPSEGDMAQARELLREGLDLRDKGDLKTALDKLKAAHALAHTPITGFELGKAYLVAGKLVEAREAFLSIKRIPVRIEETDRSRSARSEADTLAEQLRGRIPTLHVRITGVAPDSVAVTVDGASIPTEALEAPRYVNAGMHTVAARSTTGASTETQVELKEGETRDVELKIVLTGGTAPEPAATTGGPPPMATHSLDSRPAETAPRSHVLEWSLIGAGAAVGIAGGVLLGVEAGQAKDAVDRSDRSGYDSAKTLWTVGLVGAIAGGAAVVGGGIVFLLPSDRGAAATSGHASLQVRGGLGRIELAGTF
jgi:hypothetical protein